MKRIMILLLAAILLLSLCIKETKERAPAQITEAGAVTVPENTPDEAPTLTGDYSPDFRFSTTDREGNAWDESVFAQQSLTMLNFWEPWCGPCVREMPELQKLSEDYADRGFRVFGVYSTPGMEKDVDAVLESTGVRYPILHYTGDFDAFQSGYVPTTVFVDGNGRILGDGLYVGAKSYGDWAALIEGFLP